MTIQFKVYHGDIPDLGLVDAIGIDTEATGLIHSRDRLCLVQMSVHRGMDQENIIVYVKPGLVPKNLLRYICSDTLKILHYARFDIAMIIKHWILPDPNRDELLSQIKSVFCTKIASKLVRTYTDYHGLRELCREFIRTELDKSAQKTDWAATTLSDRQLVYAISDVIYLKELKDRLWSMIKRENREFLANAAMSAIVPHALIDACGFVSVFEHK